MKILKISTLITLCVCTMSIQSVTATEWNDDKLREIEQAIMDSMDQYDIPGSAVAIIEDNTVIYTKTFGYQNIEENIPLTETSILRAESISKSVTAYTVMHLVQEGMVSLDEPIANYIDFDVKESVTLHTLLTHQSGLKIGPFATHYDPLEEKPSLKQHLLETIQFDTSKENKFSYSNVGYNLIEYVIEQVTNMSFEDYVQQEIFSSLQVNDVSFAYDQTKADLYATGYDVDNKPIEVYVYPEKASGGLFTTISGLAQYISKSMQDTTVLQGQYKEALYENHIDVSGEYQLVSDGYGYGHFIEDQANKAVFHGGQGHGWMAFFEAIPEAGDGILIITNSQRSYPMISSVIHSYRNATEYEPFGIEAIYRYRHIVTVILVLLCSIPLFLFLSFLRKWDTSHYINKSDFNKPSIIIKGIGLVLLTGLVIYSYIAGYMFLEVLYPVRFEIGRFILYSTTLLLWLNYWIKKDSKSL